MDDPTMGLDPAVRRAFLESIVHVIQRSGRTVFFSTHILADVERVADRIGILDQGVLRADCPTQTFRDRVKRIRASLDESVPIPELPDAVNYTRFDDELFVTVVDYREEHADRLKEAGAREIEIEELGLEELFIEYTAGGRREMRSRGLPM